MNNGLFGNSNTEHQGFGIFRKSQNCFFGKKPKTNNNLGFFEANPAQQANVIIETRKRDIFSKNKYYDNPQNNKALLNQKVLQNMPKKDFFLPSRNNLDIKITSSFNKVLKKYDNFQRLLNKEFEKNLINSNN